MKDNVFIHANILTPKQWLYEITNKESNTLEVLYLALEMTCRGLSFKNINLEKSDSRYFLIDEDKKSLIMPWRSLDGLGVQVCSQIVKEREKGKFLSIEDVQKRAKVSQTLIDKMKEMGILEGLPDSNQLSLF